MRTCAPNSRASASSARPAPSCRCLPPSDEYQGLTVGQLALGADERRGRLGDGVSESGRPLAAPLGGESVLDAAEYRMRCRRADSTYQTWTSGIDRDDFHPPGLDTVACPASVARPRMPAVQPTVQPGPWNPVEAGGVRAGDVPCHGGEDGAVGKAMAGVTPSLKSLSSGSDGSSPSGATSSLFRRRIAILCSSSDLDAMVAGLGEEEQTVSDEADGDSP